MTTDDFASIASDYADIVDDISDINISYDADSETCINDKHEFLTEIVQEYTPRLRTYLARNVRVYDDVEDLLQDIFVRVVQYPELENIRSIKAFLFTIATNLLRDKSRRSYTKMSKYSMSIDELEIPVDSADPNQILEDRDAVKKMSYAIGDLQPTCKQAFVESRFEGKSYKEIASNLGVSVSMVEKHIIEALKQIRHAVYVQ